MPPESKPTLAWQPVSRHITRRSARERRNELNADRPLSADGWSIDHIYVVNPLIDPATGQLREGRRRRAGWPWRVVRVELPPA